MSLDQIVVLVVGIGAIAGTYWFFLMKRNKPAVATGESITIRVAGGYSPQHIAIPVGKTVTMTFLRSDPSPCLEEVVLADFKIRATLPLNKPVAIQITPQKKGTFRFACGMNMFQGTITVQ